MPGRGGVAGRTGCEGSGRGPPMFVFGRGGGGPPGRGPPGRAAVPGAAGRCAAGRLRFPVGAWDAGDGVGATGLTSIGRRGGAGGACPVLGSSTRSRIVGGTIRPVGAGIGARGGAGTCPGAAAAAGADVVSAAGATGCGSGAITGSSSVGGAAAAGGGSSAASI